MEAVSQEASRLAGRDDVIGLIRALMDRPMIDGHRQSQQRPVLVLEGARGSGKSAVLALLQSRLEQQVPFARIDFESDRSASIPDVLSAIAFQLSRNCPLYGAIAFPRFTIGRLVMTAQLNLDNRPVAYRQVMTVLQQERGIDAVRGILADTAGALVGIAEHQYGISPMLGEPMTSAAKSLPALVIRGLSRRGPGRRIVLGSYYDWFGHRGRDLPNDALDVLVDLNGFAQDTRDGENRQWINELLWDAFLTDLRDHFDYGRQSHELTLGCAMLLDNADTRVGQEFVSGLIQARADRPGSPDPLTTVITSRGDLLVDVPADQLIEYPLVSSADQDHKRWTARFRLRDLSLADTRSMVVALGIRGGNTTRSIHLVHEFTGGHPASTRVLVSALGQHPAHRDSVVTLLDQPGPGLGSGRTKVGDGLLQHLMADLPPAEFEDLITCSSAIDQHHARPMISRLEGREASFARIQPVLWPAAGGAGPKVLRCLLLRLLAQRAADHPNSWQNLFGWHRQTRAAAEDPTGELIYALAEGDLGFVVGRLATELSSTSSQRWRKLLLKVCLAPHRQPGPDLTPQEEMLKLLRRTPQTGRLEIARLVLACWIVGDPLTGSERAGLYLQSAADYEAIARTCSHDDVEPLLLAARDSRRQAELWD